MNRVHHQREDATSASRHSTHFNNEIVDLTRSFDASLQPVYHSTGYTTNSTRRDDTSPSENYYSQSLRSGFKDIRHNYHKSIDEPSNHNKYHHQYERYLQADQSLRGGSRKQLELYRSNSSLELDSCDKQQGHRRRGVGVGAENACPEHKNSVHIPSNISSYSRNSQQQRVKHSQHPELIVSSHREYGSANSLDIKVNVRMDAYYDGSITY